MRDKLIDIILEAIGYKDLRQLMQQELIPEVLLVETSSAHRKAEVIADALLASGVILNAPVTFSVGHPDPVGAKGEPGVIGIPAPPKEE